MASDSDDDLDLLGGEIDRDLAARSGQPGHGAPAGSTAAPESAWTRTRTQPQPCAQPPLQQRPLPQPQPQHMDGVRWLCVGPAAALEGLRPALLLRRGTPDIRVDARRAGRAWAGPEVAVVVLAGRAYALANCCTHASGCPAAPARGKFDCPFREKKLLNMTGKLS
jgi:hypothetical protein